MLQHENSVEDLQSRFIFKRIYFSESMSTFCLQTIQDRPSAKRQHFASFRFRDDDDDDEDDVDEEATTFSTATMQHSNVSVRAAIHQILCVTFRVDGVRQFLEDDPAEFARTVRFLGRNTDSVVAATDEDILSCARSYVEQPQHQQPAESLAVVEQPVQAIAVPAGHAEDGSSMTTDGSCGTENSNDSQSARTAMRRILRKHFPVRTVRRSLENDPDVFAAHVRSLGKDIHSIVAATDDDIIACARSYLEQPQHQQPRESPAVAMEPIDEGSGSSRMEISTFSIADPMSESDPSGPTDMSTDCTMDVSEGNGGTGGRNGSG